MNNCTYFPFFEYKKGYKKLNKGNSVEPFVYRGLSYALHARVGEDLKNSYTSATVCVTLFPESAKYKMLKDAEEAMFLCIVLLLFIFVLLIISLLFSPIP